MAKKLSNGRLLNVMVQLLAYHTLLVCHTLGGKDKHVDATVVEYPHPSDPTQNIRFSSVAQRNNNFVRIKNMVGSLTKVDQNTGALRKSTCTLILNGKTGTINGTKFNGNGKVCGIVTLSEDIEGFPKILVVPLEKLETAGNLEDTANLTLEYLKAERYFEIETHWDECKQVHEIPSKRELKFYVQAIDDRDFFLKSRRYPFFRKIPIQNVETGKYIFSLTESRDDKRITMTQILFGIRTLLFRLNPQQKQISFNNQTEPEQNNQLCVLAKKPIATVKHKVRFPDTHIQFDGQMDHYGHWTMNIS